MATIQTPVIVLGFTINHAEGVLIRVPVTTPVTDTGPEGLVRR